MAKKEQEFQYGSSFLPQGEKKYSVIRWGWNGLNRTDDIDTGQLRSMYGVVCDPPYIVPQKLAKTWFDMKNGIPLVYGSISVRLKQGTPISLFGFDNSLYLVWEYINELNKYQTVITCFTGTSSNAVSLFTWYLGDHEESTADQPRMLVQYNVANTSSGNVVEYTYDRKVLVYPDCYSVDYYDSPTSGWDNGAAFNTVLNPIPESELAAVYGSRVFGATDNAVFASAFNSYADFTLDAADDFSSAHAWWSMAQSNTEADGAVTAVVSFDNHVVVFRKDYMQLVYNNKNPFRIVDVGAFGCDSNKAWTVLNGVLYFASYNKVYAFSGGAPKDISKKLEISDLHGVVLGSFKDIVWMKTKDSIYIYKDGTWSDIGRSMFNGSSVRIEQFATLDYGIAALITKNPDSDTESKAIVFLDWDVGAMNPAPQDPDEWEPEYGSVWTFETELMALGKLDVRRVKKFTVLCEGNENAEIEVYLMPDSALPYDEYKVCSYKFSEDDRKMLRVLTRQFSGTMHRLRFVGKGYIKFYAAELKISWGGDVYVEG